MTTDHIRYDLLVQDALRGVARSVLEDAAKKGLPGDHHFFITFNTRAEGVRLSQRLQGQYPQEMTIILQHQFWDLTVTQGGFEVGLSFNGIPERLAVPFAAIKSFADPTARFEVRFEEAQEDTAAPSTAPAPTSTVAEPQHPQPKPARPQSGPKSARPKPALAAAPKAVSPTSGDGPDKPSGGAEVVRFDRFRKK